MSTYETLCNVLCEMYAANYFENITDNLTAMFKNATSAFIAEKHNNCRTATDFDDLYFRIENGIEHAASVASNRNYKFVNNVMAAF